MVDTRIILSAIWVALMLAYLLGDVLRIFSGDYQAGEMGKQLIKFTQWMWFGIAVLMAIPIVMILLTLILPYHACRSANIVAAGFFFLFNLVGLPTYPSAYDKFLIVLGLIFNLLTI